MNDESGVLIEGYERPPLIKQPWHPPYYRGCCEGAGLAKAMDLFMWELEISDREQIVPVIFKLADERRAAPRHHACGTCRAARCGRHRTASPRSTTRPGARTGASCPTTKQDAGRHYAEELQLVFDRDWFMVAETPAARLPPSP